MTQRSKKASEAVLGDDGKTVGEGNLFARSIFPDDIEKPSENRLSRSMKSVYYTDLLHNFERSDGSSVCNDEINVSND